MDLIDFDRSILSDVWTSPALWDSLSYLCDVCNGRLSGTDDERRAGDFLVEKFKEIGLRNVHAEVFEIPGWVRGETRLTVLDDNGPHDLFVMAMVGSPAGECEAEVIDLDGGKDQAPREPPPATEQREHECAQLALCRA